MTTPLRRVRHYGSAHEGTGTFWAQRLTGAANVLLVTGIIVVMAATIGRPYEEVVATVGSPLVAALFVLLFLSAAVHMRIGMYEIIADYIHGERLKIALVAASTLFAFAVGAVGVIAVLTLAIRG